MKSQWIRCSDRLPAPDTLVLIAAETEAIAPGTGVLARDLGRYLDEFGVWYVPSIHSTVKAEWVLYWAEIPEAPEYRREDEDHIAG